MKNLLLTLALVSLAGCSTIMDYFPSRWDVNQAKVITDIQQNTRHFNCKGDQLAQINSLEKSIEWFEIYAKTKPTRDVANLTSTLAETVKEYQDRLAKGPVSPVYCEIKKKLFVQQADILASTVQGRF